MWNAGICPITEILLPHTKFHWNRTIGCWVMAENDFQNGGRPPYWILKIFIFGHMTVTEFKICILCIKFHQNRMTFCWDMTILRFAIWRPSAILHFRNLEFLSPGLHGHAVLFPCATLNSDRLLSYGQKRFLKWRLSAILNFMGPIMGSLKNTCTSYRSSIEPVALNCLGFEKIAFMYTFCGQTNGWTTNQMH